MLFGSRLDVGHRKLFFLSCIIITLLFCRTIYNYKVDLNRFAPFTANSMHGAPIEDKEHVHNINDFHIKVAKGDRLIDILNRYEISKNDIYNLLSSLREKYNVRKIHEGQLINLTIEHSKQVHLISFEMEIDPIHKLVSTHNDQGEFESKVIENTKYKQIIRLSKPIKGSLFATAISHGLSDQLIMNLVHLYSKNINLNRDIKNGSIFEIIFEQFVDEKGTFSHYGNIMYASLINNKNKKFDIYRYATKNGAEGYFYSNGDYASNKQPLLGLPLTEVRTSSGFGERYHPISKKVRFHKGVDLVASIGTPVKSAGDGVIEYIGNRGGYGKYIRIKHDKYYSTAYAHLSKFKENLKVSSVVRSGEIIAYSGKTGNVTGPHLHYEVLYKSKQIDPMKVSDAVHTAHLDGEELLQFKQFTSTIQEILKQPNTKEILVDAL